MFLPLQVPQRYSVYMFFLPGAFICCVLSETFPFYAIVNLIYAWNCVFYWYITPLISPHALHYLSCDSRGDKHLDFCNALHLDLGLLNPKYTSCDTPVCLKRIFHFVPFAMHLTGVQ